jgi:hypothetical protein
MGLRGSSHSFPVALSLEKKRNEMLELPVFSPAIGSIDKQNHVVQLETIHNEACSEQLNPRFNNTTSKYSRTAINATFRDYSKYGASVIHSASSTSSTQAIYSTPGSMPNALHNLDYSAISSVDIMCDTPRSAGSNVYETYYCGFYSSNSEYAIMGVRWGTPASSRPGLRVSVAFVGAGAILPMWSWYSIVPSTHPAYSSFNMNCRSANIALMWDRRVYSAGGEGLHLFINGYWVAAIPRSPTDLERDLSTMVSSCGLYSYINIYRAAGNYTSTSYIKNMRIRPVITFGDGSPAFPYSLSFDKSYSNGPIFDCGNLYNSPQDFRYTGNPIYIKDMMSYRLKNIGKSGFYPLRVTMPISGNEVSATFENVMVNRAQNNPFMKKPPVMMVDHTLDIGDDYLDTGAVYEATNRETNPRPVQEVVSDTNGRSQAPAIIGFDHETVWNGMLDGSGDSGMVDTDGLWDAVGVKNFNETGGKMLTEESYPGAVCEYSSMGSPSDQSGTQGWPIQCNRGPTDPLEFYGDGIPPACSILMENDIKHLRFVGLNGSNTNRHKALFVGIKPTAFAGAIPTVTLQADLVIGRMLNNEMLDVSAPFGATGYYSPFGGEFANLIMCEFPRELTTTAPTFYQYPDIAIVPLGDPRTTKKHRVYWLCGVPGPVVYSYQIKYIDFDDNGETVLSASPQTINMNMSLYNQASINAIYDTPLQFDIIQPEDGKFIIVVSLGTIKTPGVGASLETTAACVMYSSNDGINFTTPIQITSGAFNRLYPKKLSHYYTTLGLPHLSYTAYGRNAGEILLCLTNMNCLSGITDDYLSTFVFKASLSQVLRWNPRQGGTPFTVLVNCRKLTSETVTGIVDSYQSQDILGAAAFRDRQGKIHVAMNKKPRDSATPAPTPDFVGGIIYAVLDDGNYASQLDITSGFRDANEGSNYNYYDVVSLTRLTWDNKSIHDNTNPSYNGYSTVLRPYFSPTENDCFFTYNCSIHPTYIAIGTMARDPAFRLFQPTTLGEIYPPSLSWNYAMHSPSEYITTHPPLPFVWTRAGVGGPVLSASGLRFANPTNKNMRYMFELNAAASTWWHRLPREAIAAKFRFKYTGTSVANPPSYSVDGAFTVKFEYITLCVDPVTGTYTYLPNIYFMFNTTSVGVRANATWYFNATGYDFTVFRDIYVIGTLSKSENIMYWNIFMEMVPNSVSSASYERKTRWSPKSWYQINTSPIVIPTLTSAAGFRSERYHFGGADIGSADPWPLANSAECKFFQVYFPMYKIQDNQILQKVSGTGTTKVDGITNNTSCVVGGPTRALGRRTRRYSFGQSSLCDAVFQIGDRTGVRGRFGDRAGLGGENFGGYNINADVANSFNPVGWSVGNNTIFTIPNSSNIEFPTDRFRFPYKFKTGINAAKDLLPYTSWVCSDDAAPVRICFDSTLLKTKRQTFRANSLWLLNTSLVNVRLKASNASSAWGVAPFNLAVDMSVDRGSVVSVWGAVATEDYLTVEDTSKNWIPNQFVDTDSPFYIVHDSTPWVGGRIVKNTKTQIWYKPSTRWNGVAFTALAVADDFRIIAPSRFVTFSLTDYRYWALEIMPNEAGDIQGYADGVARIGEFGIGESITLNDHGDIGFSEVYKNIIKTSGQNDGYDRIETSTGRAYMEYDISYTNCSEEDARAILDVFKTCKTKAVPTWFALTEHDPSNVMLCDFIDSSIDEQHSADFNDSDTYYTLTLKLRQRI